MPSLQTKLLAVYLPLTLGVFLGWCLGKLLPKSVPVYLGRLLFWLGVPVSIVAFLRGADLSGSVWIAPLVAWVAVFFGAGLAGIWIWFKGGDLNKSTQASLLLASMVGNTGYLGYPVILAIAPVQYFAWALFYDLVGTTLAAYGLGVLVAARFGQVDRTGGYLLRTVSINPALWSFAFGLVLGHVPIPALAENILNATAWTALRLSLVLIGMRLSQLSFRQDLRLVLSSLAIKMLVVPLVLGWGLRSLSLPASAHLVLCLQMAMPPAFATLILAETFHLDRDLTVAALAIGSIGLVLTLPLWLWLFGNL
jgi:malate permease and related proteins